MGGKQIEGSGASMWLKWDISVRRTEQLEVGMLKTSAEWALFLTDCSRRTYCLSEDIHWHRGLSVIMWPLCNNEDCPWTNVTSLTHFLILFCCMSFEFLSWNEPGERSTVWLMSCLWNICSLNSCISAENSLGTSALMKLQTTHLEKVILSFLLNWLLAYFFFKLHFFSAWIILICHHLFSCVLPNFTLI